MMRRRGCRLNAMPRLGRVLVLAGALALALEPAASDALDRSGAERELVTLTNSDRTSNSLPSLRPSDPLGGVARGRSQDMADRDYFSHAIPPDGIYFEALLPPAGIPFRLAGENIARNNADDNETVRRAETGFLSSPTHRANIMEANYREVGVGAWDRADRMKYFTVLFLQPPGAAAATAPSSLPARGGTPGDAAGGPVDALLGWVATAHAQAAGPINDVPATSEGSGRRAGAGAAASAPAPAPVPVPAAASRPARASTEIVASQPAQLGLLDGIITRVLKLYLSV